MNATFKQPTKRVREENKTMKLLKMYFKTTVSKEGGGPEDINDNICNARQNFRID